MRNLAKRSLAIIIAVLMLISMTVVGISSVSAANYFNGGNKLYLRPNSQWSMNSARFAAYFFTSTDNKWVDMTDSDGDGYYEVTIPDGYWSTVVFCRMNPEFKDNNWSTETEDRLWNQTANLSCDGYNDCYEMTGGSWNEGTWSVYAQKLVYFVNTKNWDKVNAYCVNSSLAGNTWPGKSARLINADLGVYACYPGNYPLVRFTDGTSEGEYTSQYNYADVAGKYIEPITGGVYTSAAEALTYANSNSVFFVNTLGWDNVKGYGWTDGIGSNTSWPGKAATLINDEKSVYAFDPADRVKVLFNDGTDEGARTSYFTSSSVRGKYIEPKTGQYYNSAEEAWAAASSDVVYFVNTLGWDSVAGYGWTNGIGSNTEYPGTEATLINAKYDVYSYAPGDRKQVLFNDNSVNSGVHTSYYYCSDVYGKYIEPKTGGVYSTIADALNAAKYAEPPATEETTAPTEATTTEPTNLDVALAGDFNDWSQTETKFTHYGAYDYQASVTLAAGTYYFKVVHESLWHGSGSTINDSTDGVTLSATGGNCVLNASGGQYDFYYNTATNKLSVLYTKVEVEGGEEAAPTVVLSGSFNAWATDDVMTSVGGNVVEKKVTLENGQYFFNIVENGSWYSTSYGDAIYDTINNDPLVVNGGVIRFNATGGDYTFRYDYVKNTITITAEIITNPSELAAVYIAGDFNSWDPTANKLTVLDNYKVSTTIKLAAGTYAFKIVDDALWYGNDGVINDTTETTSSFGWALKMEAGNCTLKASGGTYTFTYDVVGRVLTVSCVPSDEDYAETAKVYLAGDFNNWDSKATLFGYSSKNVVSTSIELKSGTYYFKLVEGGLWYGNNATFDNTVANLALSSTGNNCVLNATGGTYTFNYNVVTKKLSVTFKASDEDLAQTANVCVAGDFNGWSQTANKMTRYNKNIMMATMELSRGTYKFKLVHESLWYGNDGTIVDTTTATSDNGWVMSMTAPECTLQATGGTYTFMYNLVTKELVVTAEITAEDPAKTATVCVAGDFNGWSQTTNKMTYSAENTVSTTVEIPAGTHYFKIVNDGLWYGNNGTIVDTTTSTSSSGWEMSMTAPECVLEATGGKYTFKYNVVTNKLVVTAEITAEDPAKTATVSVAGDFNGWSQTANKLTYSAENTVSTTVNIETGTHYFKIVHNNLWYGNSGTIADTTTTTSSNGWDMSMTASECILKATGGKYTFTYNVVTKKLVVTAEITAEDPAKTAKVSVAGDFNEWSKTANTMTYSAENIVSTTIELGPGSYAFKIVDGDLWYGNTGTIEDTTSDTGWEMDPTTGNCTLAAVGTGGGGIYTFTYNVVTKKLVVTCVAYEAPATDPAKTAKVTLAGDFNEWSETATPFTYSEENVVSTSVFLFPGDYKFKIIDDGVWYGNNGTFTNTTGLSAELAWPMENTAGNCTLQADGGTYTFNYNVVTKKLQVLCALDDYDPAQYSDVRLVGSFNEWDTEAAKMTYVGDRAVLIDVELEAGTYEFKIVEDGAWYSNSGTIVNKTTDTSDIGWTLSDTEQTNCKLEASGGKYTFIYRVVPNTIIIFHNYDHNYLG